MGRLTELDLIRRIRAGARTRNTAVRLGIGDDAALLRVRAGEEVVVTTDFSLEGRHFRRDWHSPASAGHRCLARGLSDIAAMGGRPVAAFLSLALPKGFDLVWVDGLLTGFHALAARYGVELAGGDTAEAPGDAVMADVVVVGAVEEGKALRRSGGRAGDRLYVTGELGGAAADLLRLAGGLACPAEYAEGHPGSFPAPRVEAGRELVRRGLATACLDLSDGLSTDLRHLCEASGLGAQLAGAALPVAEGATVEQALNGGEDYELLFAVPKGRRVAAQIAGVRVSCIGRLVEGSGVRLDGEELPPGGWEHFHT